MKKFISLLLVILSVLCLFSGCSNKTVPPVKDCYITYKIAIYSDKNTENLTASVEDFSEGKYIVAGHLKYGDVTFTASKISDIVKIGEKFNLPIISIDCTGEGAPEVYFWYVSGTNTKISDKNEGDLITCDFGAENVTIVVGVGPSDAEWS